MTKDVKIDKSTLIKNSYKTALWYCNLGFTVIPCTIDKKPMIAWKKLKSYYNADMVKEYARKKPGCLWAVPCNQGFSVIDCDSYKPEFQSDKNSVDLELKLKQVCGYRQKTQSGGRHYFVKGTLDKNKPISKAVDVRTEGGIAVLYLIPTSKNFKDKEEFLKALPKSDQFIQSIQKKSKEIVRQVNPKISVGIDKEWTEGNRNNTLNSKLYGYMLNNKIDKAVETIETALRLKKPSDPADEIPNTIKSVRESVQKIKQDQAIDNKITIHENLPIVPIKPAIKGWLWFNVLNIILGDSGVGKTSLFAYLATINYQKKAFWPGGPEGDGRPSFYICYERKLASIRSKNLASGGNFKEIEIFKKKGKHSMLDMDNEQDVEAFKQQLFDQDGKAKYFMVCFDPVNVLVKENNNNNDKVRASLEKFLLAMGDIQTAFILIQHIGKLNQGKVEGSEGIGANAFKNIAEASIRVKEIVDEAGQLKHFVAGKIKANNSSKRKGGLIYKTEDVLIDDKENKFIAAGESKTVHGIKSIEHSKKSLTTLWKNSVKDVREVCFVNKKDQYKEKLEDILNKRMASGKKIMLEDVRNDALDAGISPYYFDRSVNWYDFGYRHHRPYGQKVELVPSNRLDIPSIPS